MLLTFCFFYLFFKLFTLFFPVLFRFLLVLLFSLIHFLFSLINFFFHLGLSNNFCLFSIDNSMFLSVKFISFWLEHFFADLNVLLQRLFIKRSATSLWAQNKILIKSLRIFERLILNSCCHCYLFLVLFLIFHRFNFWIVI